MCIRDRVSTQSTWDKNIFKFFNFQKTSITNKLLNMSCCNCIMKTFVVLIGLILMGFGAAILIYISTQVGNLADYIPSDDVNKWSKAFAIAIIVVAAVLILVGLSGIIGALRQNKCLLRFFNSFIVFFCLLFLAIGIFCLVAFAKIKDKIDCKHDKLGVLKKANELVVDASLIFCQTNTCSCQSVLNSKDPLYTGVVRVQQCANFKKVIGDNHSD
eukprot:TRINITY_DN152_c0_g1_i4.p2 TRINITY_DN152_c0_g1~~TRINITY_DN152_c0_g1_i4.p2  ORF type:complete len:230 (-),score=71.60 TRINITY_DN152_c0_g1_i4:315-959(-)